MPPPPLTFDCGTVRHRHRGARRWAADSAGTLVKHPPLLLPDKPGQGLDATRQPCFRAVLEAICAASPVALVYVSQ